MDFGNCTLIFLCNLTILIIEVIVWNCALMIDAPLSKRVK